MASSSVQLDEEYEFSAPKYFDFMNEETEEEIRRAEIWFDRSISHAPSPFMPKIKEGRTVKIESLCDFGDVEMTSTKEPNSMEQNYQEQNTAGVLQDNEITLEMKAKEGKEGRKTISFDFIPESKTQSDTSEVSSKPQKETSVLVDSAGGAEPSFEFPIQQPRDMQVTGNESSTPKVHANPVKGTGPSSSRNTTAKKIASLFQNPSVVKPKPKTPGRQSPKSSKLKSVIKSHSGKLKSAAATDNNNNIAQENQAVKRQKLDGGKSRPILNAKPVALAHKSRLGLQGSTGTFSTALKEATTTTPFISAAEMVKKFESKTRELDISHTNKSLSHDDTTSLVQRKPRLVLTRPKEPDLQTAHRVRAVRVKSTAELEAEMLAKIPKFKARPVNKKIFEAPSIPTLNKSTLQLPEFQEFHLRTMERATRHAETSSEASTVDFTFQSKRKPLKLTEPKPPQLETALRARPTIVKTSQELELEQLEKAPKFKARPLNRKILDSNGEIGLSACPKPPITTPKEFHFATNDRLGPPSLVLEQFDKMSLHSESSQIEKQEVVPRLTIPNPFHLQTDERGHEKEKQLQAQLIRKKMEEEKARIPKANPYPYTTDYPVVPPKPEPKPYTKPSIFQLESLVRHEEELSRKMEERERMEREEAEWRLFRAQRVLKEDPIPLPGKVRIPLTEVQGFALQVDQRSVKRQEFENKVKEKETMYKRLREEAETVKQMEDEKALKQLRRTMVPHARPLPKFENPFVPQKSTKEVTKAKSPHLHVVERGQRRRHPYMR